MWALLVHTTCLLQIDPPERKVETSKQELMDFHRKMWTMRRVELAADQLYKQARSEITDAHPHCSLPQAGTIAISELETLALLGCSLLTERQRTKTPQESLSDDWLLAVQKLARGFLHLADGQEAIPCGMEAALTFQDSMIQSYRCVYEAPGVFPA